MDKNERGYIMNKKRVIVPLVFCGVGILLLIAEKLVAMNGDNEGVSTSSYFMIFYGVIGLIGEYINTRPQNKYEYERKCEEREMDNKDARNVAIQNKVGYGMWYATVIILYILYIIAVFTHANPWITYTLMALVVGETFVFDIICRSMKRKKFAQNEAED